MPRPWRLTLARLAAVVSIAALLPAIAATSHPGKGPSRTAFRRSHAAISHSTGAGAQGADISAAVSGSPDPVPAGDQVTFEMTVINSGPDRADFVIFDSSMTGAI